MQGGLGSLLASGVHVLADLHLGCTEVSAIPMCMPLFIQVLPVAMVLLCCHLHIMASLRDSVSFFAFGCLSLSPCRSSFRLEIASAVLACVNWNWGKERCI